VTREIEAEMEPTLALRDDFCRSGGDCTVQLYQK
jgi:hypothetical protein